MPDNDKPLAEFDGNGGYYVKVYAGDKEGQYNLVAYVSEDAERWPAISLVMSQGREDVLSRGEAMAQASLGIMDNMERTFGNFEQGREGNAKTLTIKNVEAESAKDLMDKALNTMGAGIEMERMSRQIEYERESRSSGGSFASKASAPKTIAPEDMQVVGSRTQALKQARFEDQSKGGGASRG